MISVWLWNLSKTRVKYLSVLTIPLIVDLIALYKNSQFTMTKTTMFTMTKTTMDMPPLVMTSNLTRASGLAVLW